MQLNISPINLVVEGYSDEMVLRRILDHIGLTCGTVYGKEGKAKLIERLARYNQAARFASWLVVIDLDQDSDCAPTFIKQILGERSETLLLRIAVRTIEAWLIADSERIASFLGISPRLVPSDPDRLPDPKLSLVNLARRSRRKAIIEDFVPKQASGARVGPGYIGRLVEFVGNKQIGWRPEIAMQRSDSLQRCLNALQALKQGVS